MKNEREIAYIRQACQIVKDTFQLLESKLQAGITTKQLDDLAYKYISSVGAVPACLGYHGYPASICTSLNNCIVHGIPSEKQVLQEGDILSIDLVVQKDGYHGDAARTYAIGKIDKEAEKLIKVTRECFFKGIENLYVGTPLYNIGAKIQQHAESNGFQVVREFVGHGIGKNMHEDPSIPNYGKMGTGIRLKAGMVLCIEPMIVAGDREVKILEDNWSAVTKDGSLAAHYENTILITEEGVSVLTE